MSCCSVTVHNGDRWSRRRRSRCTEQPAQALGAGNHHAVRWIAQGPAARPTGMCQQPLVLAEIAGVDTVQRRRKSFEIRYPCRQSVDAPGEQLDALVGLRAANGLEKMAFAWPRCSSRCFPPCAHHPG
jgi:hypothetical protein